MTYLVLARKWRPRSFDTLVGQDHVVRALAHALDTQRLHHAWLFTGTRGVGKTTLSRILAKSLNCETGITSKPCGTCRACVEIDAGRYVDYVELDAASNRGVDEMTQLLEQAVYAPSSARFKVYMIDEVHMLTGHAFNAMLKTLEEPPPHVKFILATTDPQKIPVTVLSRCLQFNLKHMTVDAIVDHLKTILAEEGLAFEAPALRLLAQAAGGSMRDALSLTDQAIAYSAGNLTLDSVQAMLGTIDQRHLVRLLHALAEGRAPDVVAVADELASRGLSYAGALADLAALLSRVAIAQRVPGALPDDDPISHDIAGLARVLHPDLLQLYYSVAVHSRSELSLAPDEYAGFVMACLRMLSLTPATPPLPPLQGPQPGASGTSAAVEGGAAAAHSEAASPAGMSAVVVEDDGPDIPAWEDLPEEAVVPAAVQPSMAIPVLAQEPQTAESLSSQEPVQQEQVQQEPVLREPASPVPVSQEQEPANPPSAVDAVPDVPAWEDPADAEPDASAWVPVTEDDIASFDSGDWEPVLSGESGLEVAALAPLAQDVPASRSRVPRLARMTAEDWPALAASLPLTGLAAELARQSEWVGVDGDTITLRVAVQSLAVSKGQARLRTVLTEHFGKVVHLKVEFGATGGGTAHAMELKRRAQRQKEAEDAVANDPFVRSLLEEFGARILPGSIAAVDEGNAA